MDTTKLLNKIDEYKETLTFDKHKEQISELSKSIRKALAIKELASLDGVKQLTAEIQERINKTDFLLKSNRKMTQEERTTLFTQRDIYEWFLSFFENANKIIKSAENIVK